MKNMRILHITNDCFSGAGKAALRLHEGLRGLGIDSKLLVVYDGNRDPNDGILLYSENGHILNKIRRRLCKLVIAHDYAVYRNTIPENIGQFTDDRSPFRVIDHPLMKDADIINLHWLAGMIDYGTFFPGLHGKKVAWTLHDMNPFTGGCHYSQGCSKYKLNCGACPQLGSDKEKDLSRKIYDRKKCAYNELDADIVTPSKWLAGIAKESSLLGKYRIRTIPNGVPADIFTPRDKNSSRKLLGLPENKTLLLFWCGVLVERRGCMHVVEALKKLHGKTDTSDLALVVIGDLSYKLPSDIGYTYYPAGHIHDERLLSCYYNAADFLVSANWEDNFPNQVLESMACGTPVIGCNSAGVPEMLAPHGTGLLFEQKNTDDLAQKIAWMITHPAERKEMGRRAIELTEKEYTREACARRYIEFYNRILAGAA